MMISRKSKVLVTGGAGFIGSHQVDALVAAGYNVVVVDDLSSGKKENINPKAKLIEMDIRDEKLTQVFAEERPDYVFHFAAQISVNRSLEDPMFDADINIIGGLNLLEACVAHKVKKIMFSSTGGALYGEAEEVPTPEHAPTVPISPYGIAKLSLENYIRFFYEQFGLEFGIMRYANVYGPRQDSKGEAGVIAIFTEKLMNQEQPYIHGDGHQTRDYVFVADVVQANMIVFESEAVGTYNVGTSRQTTVNEIFNLIKNHLGSPFVERYSEGFPGQEVSCLSNAKLQADFGWLPDLDIKSGIEQTVDWFKS